MNRGDQRGVARGVGGVLVIGEEGGAAGDDLVKRACLALAEGDDLAWIGELFHARRVGRRAAAPDKGFLVKGHRHVVEFDGFHQRGFGYGHPAFLEGVAEHEHVGGDGVAEQRSRYAAGIDKGGVGDTGRVCDVQLQVGSGHLPVGVLDEGGGGRAGGVDHKLGAGFIHARKRINAGRDHQVATDHQIGVADAHANSVQFVG